MNLAPDHCQDVLDGVYDLPFLTFDGKAPIVIDIGANVGAYCLWASRRWPGCVLHAYEPHPENCAELRRTLDHHKLKAEVHQTAVLDYSGTAGLFEGKNNCGECSIWMGAEQVQKSIIVPVMDAIELPRGDVLKIDTEGAEGIILRRLRKTGQLPDFKIVSLEYHGEVGRRSIDDVLEDFTLGSCSASLPHRGVLNYLRTDLLRDFKL